MNKILYIYLLLFSLFFFFSCEDSSPALGSVRHIVLYEYDDSSSIPNERLSVYVELESDPLRIYQMSIRSIDTGYEWKIEDTNSDTVWIGSSNLMSTQNPFFEGQYILTYTDLAQRKTDLYFSISSSHDEKFPDKSMYTNKNIVIFDELNTLLYFGNDLTISDESTIMQNYPQAKTVREVSISQDSKSAIIEPVIQITKEEKND